MNQGQLIVDVLNQIYLAPNQEARLDLETVRNATSPQNCSHTQVEYAQRVSELTGELLSYKIKTSCQTKSDPKKVVIFHQKILVDAENTIHGQSILEISTFYIN